jgi:hypothetical protein
MAIFSRKGQIGDRLVHHSDRGVQGGFKESSSTRRSVTPSGWKISARSGRSGARAILMIMQPPRR